MYTNAELLALEEVAIHTNFNVPRRNLGLTGGKKYLKIAVDAVSLFSVAIACYILVYCMHRMLITASSYIMLLQEVPFKAFSSQTNTEVEVTREIWVELILNNKAVSLFSFAIEEQ